MSSVCFCIKYLCLGVAGKYVDKPYISCIRLWYTTACSLNGSSRTEEPYMSCVRFWRTLLKPGVPGKCLNKTYMSCIRLWHKLLQAKCILVQYIMSIFGFGVHQSNHFASGRYFYKCTVMLFGFGTELSICY